MSHNFYLKFHSGFPYTCLRFFPFEPLEGTLQITKSSFVSPEINRDCNGEHLRSLELPCYFVLSPVKAMVQIARGTETLKNAKCSVGLGSYLMVTHMV